MTHSGPVKLVGDKICQLNRLLDGDLLFIYDSLAQLLSPGNRCPRIRRGSGRGKRSGASEQDRGNPLNMNLIRINASTNHPHHPIPVFLNGHQKAAGG